MNVSNSTGNTVILDKMFYNFEDLELFIKTWAGRSTVETISNKNSLPKSLP